MRRRWAGRAGLLLALLSLLGQFAIATPHATEQLVAGLAPPSWATRAQAPASVARAGHTAAQHDPARCPICQASALARTSLSSAWLSAAPLPLAGESPVLALEPETVPAAPVDGTAAPRAPPARRLPA